MATIHNANARSESPNMFDCCGREIKVTGRFIKLARLDADKYLFVDDPAPLLSALRQDVAGVDLFTFMQRLPQSKLKYLYACETDNLAAVPISTFDDWWTRQVNDKTRNMVRKAEKKNVTVREVPLDEVLVRGIWSIYNESPVRQGKPFVHFGKSLEQVRENASTYLDHSFFLAAFLGDEVIGFAKLITDETRTQAAFMNIASLIRHRDKAPTNALIAQAVRVCAEKSIPYLVYESFPTSHTNNDYLSSFKRHNGFVQFDLPRYYVPLTRKGSIALRLGLHRSLKDHCPEIMLEKLKALRNAWYERKARLTVPSASEY